MILFNRHFLAFFSDEGAFPQERGVLVVLSFVTLALAAASDHGAGGGLVAILFVLCAFGGMAWKDRDL